MDGWPMRLRLLLPIITLAVGCAYSTSSKRAPGAPELPPSAFAEVLRSAPDSSAVLIGTVHARGNNWQSPASCETQLVNEARKLGANAVLTTPADASLGRGPACDGRAYLVKSKP